MTNQDHNTEPKSLNNLSNDAVDGKNVMGGGFGDAGMIEDGVNTVLDPFTAPQDMQPQDFMPPMDGGNPGPVPFNGNGPLDGPLGHDLPHGPGPV